MIELRHREAADPEAFGAGASSLSSGVAAWAWVGGRVLRCPPPDRTSIRVKTTIPARPDPVASIITVFPDVRSKLTNEYLRENPPLHVSAKLRNASRAASL